jgi:hypothetical protein
LTISTGAREEQWVNTFERVRDFVKAHGRAPRCTCDNEVEAFLGKWCLRQRRKVQAGRLSAERKRLVTGIGILAPGNEPEFQEKLDACSTFIAVHGRPPSVSATDPEEKSLYYWRAGQQHLRSIGKLKPHREQLLNEKGIFQTAFEYEWHSFFARLKKFIEIHGRAPVRLSANPEEAQLGQWRQQQFSLYKAGKLDEYRSKQLETLGVATTLTNVNWNRSFRELQAFVAEHKSLPTRRSEVESERQLARWLETQRQLQRSEELPSRRLKLIESLDMPENRLEDRWEKMLSEVQAFIKKHDRLPSTNSSRVKERSLAVWCYRQRTEYRAGRLKADRLKHVEQLGLLQDRKREQWKTRYKQVYQFSRIHGALPKNHAIDRTERTLGRWCDHQRYLHSQGKQSKDRISILRTAGIIR